MGRRYWIGLWALLLAGGCGDAKKPIPAANSDAETKTVESAQATPAAATVRIAAASDLKFALDEVIGQFSKQHGHIEVKPTYGSSGSFFAQLTNKAPFDLFLSADIEFPRKLIADGLAVADSQFQYAVGQIVVWVPNDSKLDLTRGMEALVDPAARKIAIANPEHAPYGRAAEAAMKKLGVYEQVRERLVLAENIAQAAQFVESGAADAGIIAMSLALAPVMKEKGRYWMVPLDAYPTLEQGGVILNWAQDKAAVEKFKAFMMGSEGKTILKQYGFILPGE